MGIAPEYVPYYGTWGAILRLSNLQFWGPTASLHTLVLEARVGQKCFKPSLYGMWTRVSSDLYFQI